jgi:DNA-binding MarR family transcriptional regulator
MATRFPVPRLGSTEETILDELRRAGGPVPRRLLVSVVYATTASATYHTRSLSSRRTEEPLAATRALQNAESTLSRALRSLERKGLITRTLSGGTRQTLISVTNPPAPPPWEQDARAEEALATRCDVIAAELAELARRARRRASQLRVERRSTATVLEHNNDITQWRGLMSSPPV